MKNINDMCRFLWLIAVPVILICAFIGCQDSYEKMFGNKDSTAPMRGGATSSNTAYIEGTLKKVEFPQYNSCVITFENGEVHRIRCKDAKITFKLGVVNRIFYSSNHFTLPGGSQLPSSQEYIESVDFTNLEKE